MDQPLTARDEHAEIREEVRKLCARFPGEYWRKLDAERGYPTEFVTALTEAGYSRRPHPRGIWRLRPAAARCRRRSSRRSTPAAASAASATPRCTSWARSCGTARPSRSSATSPPSPAANSACRPSASPNPPAARTPPACKHHAPSAQGDNYVVNGQKVWTSRALHSDLMLLLARTTPRDQVKRKTDGLSAFLVDLREAVGHGMEIRPLADDDEPQRLRGVHGQPASCPPPT